MVQPLGACWLIGVSPAGRLLRRGEVPKAGMRPVSVVLDSPNFDNDLGPEQRGELLDVEQFVAGSAVARLDERVPPGRAGVDERGAGESRRQ